MIHIHAYIPYTHHKHAYSQACICTSRIHVYMCTPYTYIPYTHRPYMPQSYTYHTHVVYKYMCYTHTHTHTINRYTIYTTHIHDKYRYTIYIIHTYTQNTPYTQTYTKTHHTHHTIQTQHRHTEVHTRVSWMPVLWSFSSFVTWVLSLEELATLREPQLLGDPLWKRHHR